MSDSILDIQNLKHEIPEELGDITDIQHSNLQPDPGKAKKVLKVIRDTFTDEDGYINTFFSTQNIRNRTLIEGEDVDSSISIWRQTYTTSQAEIVPFALIVALSGGPDSALVAQTAIDAYKNRRQKEKTPFDSIVLVTFAGELHHDRDAQRARHMADHFVKTYKTDVPVSTFHHFYPFADTQRFIESLVHTYPFLYGRIENVAQSLTNNLITAPSEEAAYLCSIDTTNLTEFLLDEVTNGSNGGTNTALFTRIPKSIVLGLSEYYGLDARTESENSTTWKNKAESYLSGASASDTKRVFYAIDVVHYLAIAEGLSVEEIARKTQYKQRFVKNIFARLLNHAKRFHVGGQEYKGDYSPLEPKERKFFDDYYPDALRPGIKAFLGL